MLMKIETMKIVTKLPHEAEFKSWRSKISDSDYDKVVDAINDKIDQSDINTAGWLPGSNWDGTVFEPLYIACGKNQNASALFFGLIVFETLMYRKDTVWGFDRFELNGVKIRSMTYYVLHSVNPSDYAHLVP